MKRKDKHINKFLHDPLPDPEIRADDAWADMRDMLDAAEDHGANGQGRFSQIWKSIGKLGGLLVVTSALVVISGVVSLIVLNTKTKNQKSTDNQSIKSKIQDSALVKTDTRMPVLHPDTNHFGVATAASETSLPKIISAPGAVASSDLVIAENEHIEIESKHSSTARANSRRTHTADMRAGHKRAGDTRANAIQAGVTGAQNLPANANGRDTFPTPSAQQHQSAPANRLSTGQAEQETVQSFSLEKNTNTTTAQKSPDSLEPRAVRFESTKNDLSKLVKKPNVSSKPQPPVKDRSSMWEGVHFGPEWNINRSIVSTDYIFAGADSIKHPARLAIPGLFVSKNWNRHTATFIFNPLHSYFGDKGRVAQRVDTVRVTDSIFHKVDHNTNLIKAFGLNFSLQYQYRIASSFSLVGGFSYARYSAALLRTETDYQAGAIVPGGHLAAKGQEVLKSYIRPQQWNIRAGILFHSPSVLNNRLQFAWMTIFPVSNLSLNGFKSIKPPNVQVSLRFLVR